MLENTVCSLKSYANNLKLFEINRKKKNQGCSLEKQVFLIQRYCVPLSGILHYYARLGLVMNCYPILACCTMEQGYLKMNGQGVCCGSTPQGDFS